MQSKIAVLAVACLLVACNDDKPKSDPAAIPTFKIVGTPPAPSASESAARPTPASATAESTASATPPPKSSGATTLASATPKASASASSPAAPLKPASTRLSGKNFALDVASPGCRVNEPCSMTLKLSVLGDYHVNKEYPYKFVGAAAPNVTYLADASTFSRASGDFKEEGEKAATMTVRFKATSAGEARITGTYKMSVCSAENCQIEQQAVALSVPVM